MPIKTQFNTFVAELIGSFALVFAGTVTIVVNDTVGSVSHVGIAMTIGLTVTAIIYSIGDDSGPHINPVVTLGFWVARRFDGKLAAPYIAAQLCGAIVATRATEFIEC